jgi:hypothetical protein
MFTPNFHGSENAGSPEPNTNLKGLDQQRLRAARLAPDAAATATGFVIEGTW